MQNFSRETVWSRHCSVVYLIGCLLFETPLVFSAILATLHPENNTVTLGDPVVFTCCSNSTESDCRLRFFSLNSDRTEATKLLCNTMVPEKCDRYIVQKVNTPQCCIFNILRSTKADSGTYICNVNGTQAYAHLHVSDKVSSIDEKISTTQKVTLISPIKSKITPIRESVIVPMSDVHSFTTAAYKTLKDSTPHSESSDKTVIWVIIVVILVFVIVALCIYVTYLVKNKRNHRLSEAPIQQNNGIPGEMDPFLPGGHEQLLLTRIVVPVETRDGLVQTSPNGIGTQADVCDIQQPMSPNSIGTQADVSAVQQPMSPNSIGTQVDVSAVQQPMSPNIIGTQADVSALQQPTSDQETQTDSFDLRQQVIIPITLRKLFDPQQQVFSPREQSDPQQQVFSPGEQTGPQQPRQMTAAGVSNVQQNVPKSEAHFQDTQHQAYGRKHQAVLSKLEPTLQLSPKATVTDGQDSTDKEVNIVDDQTSSNQKSSDGKPNRSTLKNRPKALSASNVNWMGDLAQIGLKSQHDKDKIRLASIRKAFLYNIPSMQIRVPQADSKEEGLMPTPIQELGEPNLNTVDLDAVRRAQSQNLDIAGSELSRSNLFPDNNENPDESPQVPNAKKESLHQPDSLKVDEKVENSDDNCATNSLPFECDAGLIAKKSDKSEVENKLSLSDASVNASAEVRDPQCKVLSNNGSSLRVDGYATPSTPTSAFEEFFLRDTEEDSK